MSHSGQRRRVLIVSPNFPPINAPDMQRVRLALPYLRRNGWEPVVLAVDAESSGTGVFEPLLEKTYPDDIRVIRVRGVLPGRTRWLGVGSLWWRCGRALEQAGTRLLAAEPYDLVFFSTTQFDAFTLGARWLRRFGVPYVLDYQDPWINNYYRRTGTRPPGGHLKFAVTQWLARRREPAAVKKAAGIVTVSESYANDLMATYRDLSSDRFTLLPFGAAPSDFAVAAHHRPAAPLIDFNDGMIHHVYAGRCGHDMELALTILFRAFRAFREANPAVAARIRFDFIGTDYAHPPHGREWAKPIAQAEKVASSVMEHPARVPYFDVLHYLQKASALLGIGSTDPTYAASKLFPYVLARRPLLLLYHQQSLVLKFATEIGAGIPFAFTDAADVEAVSRALQLRWFDAESWNQPATVEAAAFHPFTAEALTARLAETFNRAVDRPAHRR